MNISVCIATYNRLERLAALLDDLVHQEAMPYEVVVVDNDATGSAAAVVESLRNSAPPFIVHYSIQPLKNIALTRNQTVERASGEWLAFIDDDERAPPFWLARLTAAAQAHAADGVLGPVEPVVPAEAPLWIRKGKFYDFHHMPSGTIVPPNRLRFGNVLLRAHPLRSLDTLFDPAYGLTGGEDGDMLSRLTLAGARIIWCDEALVYEPVEASRLSLSWLLRRSLRGGQDFARHSLAGRYGPRQTRRFRLFIGALLQLLVAAGLALLALPIGRHHAVHWLAKASANLGKLSIFAGWHYREYA
ncbi:MAG TPA: glycosyltransferase family 2 protein [Steroidobacteraceae bacterium]|jgi:succinoglycan biosynthesis protein ExoM|nr:glycosyltransferase family 2 protein [Steroidobacteraceae bacterium]